MAHIQDNTLQWAQRTMAELLSAWTEQHAALEKSEVELEALHIDEAKRTVALIGLHEGLDHDPHAVYDLDQKLSELGLLPTSERISAARKLLEKLGDD